MSKFCILEDDKDQAERMIKTLSRYGECEWFRRPDDLCSQLLIRKAIGGLPKYLFLDNDLGIQDDPNNKFLSEMTGYGVAKFLLKHEIKIENVIAISYNTSACLAIFSILKKYTNADIVSKDRVINPDGTEFQWMI